MNRRVMFATLASVLFAPQAVVTKLERRERLVDQYSMFKGWMYRHVQRNAKIEESQERFFRNGIFPCFKIDEKERKPK
jgi:hypothetical protein